MRQCKECLLYKDESEFYARRNVGGCGYDSYCKICRRIWTKQSYSIEQNRANKNKNRTAWISFFDSHYGKNPQCSICSKKLNWVDIGNKSGSVHWDHRHGVDGLKYSPSDWYPSRLFNDKNKKLWLDFDFGILCHNCNKSLPTLDREQWVRNVNKYVFGV